MAWIAVGTAAIAAAPAIYKGIQGISQTNKANAMHPVDPGYQVNQRVIDRARTLSNQYTNYSLPGYSQIGDQIDRNSQEAFYKGSEGATSGGDLLDLATRMAYQKNRAFGDLNVANAQGKQGALGAFLDADAAAGQEFVNANAYERDKYQGQLREKAALTQAGAENTYGAIDQLSSAASTGVSAYATSKGINGFGAKGTTAASAQEAALIQKLYSKYFPN